MRYLPEAVSGARCRLSEDYRDRQKEALIFMSSTTSIVKIHDFTTGKDSTMKNVFSHPRVYSQPIHASKITITSWVKNSRPAPRGVVTFLKPHDKSQSNESRQLSLWVFHRHQDRKKESDLGEGLYATAHDSYALYD